MSMRADPARSKRAITRDLFHRLVSVTSKSWNPYTSVLLKAAWLLFYLVCKNLTHTIRIGDVLLLEDPVDHIIVTLNSYKFSKGHKTFAVHEAGDEEFCPVVAVCKYLTLRPLITGS